MVKYWNHENDITITYSVRTARRRRRLVVCLGGMLLACFGLHDQGKGRMCVALGDADDAGADDRRLDFADVQDSTQVMMRLYVKRGAESSLVNQMSDLVSNRSSSRFGSMQMAWWLCKSSMCTTIAEDGLLHRPASVTDFDGSTKWYSDTDLVRSIVYRALVCTCECSHSSITCVSGTVCPCISASRRAAASDVVCWLRSAGRHEEARVCENVSDALVTLRVPWDLVPNSVAARDVVLERGYVHLSYDQDGASDLECSTLKRVWVEAWTNAVMRTLRSHVPELAQTLAQSICSNQEELLQELRAECRSVLKKQREERKRAMSQSAVPDECAVSGAEVDRCMPPCMAFMAKCMVSGERVTFHQRTQFASFLSQTGCQLQYAEERFWRARPVTDRIDLHRIFNKKLRTHSCSKMASRMNPSPCYFRNSAPGSASVECAMAHGFTLVEARQVRHPSDLQRMLLEKRRAASLSGGEK